MSNFYLWIENKKTKRTEHYSAIDHGSYYTYIRQDDNKKFSEDEFKKLSEKYFLSDPKKGC